MLITQERSLLKGKSLVYVKCDYCGRVIKTTYKNYLNGHKNINKDSCVDCVGKKCAEITLEKRQAEYFPKLLQACEAKGYVLTSKSSDIINNKTYVKYLCPSHGEQQMRVHNLLVGKGCPKCQSANASKRNRFDKEYILKAVSSCGGKLINPDEYINNHTKNLQITCPSCGEIFTTSLVTFTQHGGQVCNKCSKVESVGEMKIRNYLENHNIKFYQEYWFDDCRDINPLPFDFYIPEINLVIEFDGRQHFVETNLFSYSLKKTKAHDAIKNNYCKNNNIKILRIPYTHIRAIEQVLDKEFT